MYCWKCGMEMKEGQKFCPQCGARQDSKDQTTGEQGTSSSASGQNFFQSGQYQEFNSQYQGSNSQYQGSNSQYQGSYYQSGQYQGSNSQYQGSSYQSGSYQGGSPQNGPRRKPTFGQKISAAWKNSVGSMALKIIALVLAFIFACNVLASIPHLLRSLTLFANGFATHAIVIILDSLIGFAVSLFLCGLSLMTALHRTNENKDGILACFGIAGILRIFTSLVFLVLCRQFFHIPYTLSGTPNLFVLIAGFLALFVISAATEEVPFISRSSEEIKQSINAVFRVFQELNDQQTYQTQTDSQWQNSGTGYNSYQSGTGYQAGPAPQRSPMGVRALKTNRSIWTYILFNFLTCGIYSFVFISNLADDVNTVCDGDGKKTPGLLRFFLLNLVTCGFYSFIWMYKLGNRLQANAPRYGMQFQEGGTTILLWMLIGSLLCGIGAFIAMYFVIKNINALCIAYNRYNGVVYY